MPADDTAGVVGVTGPHQGEQTVTAGTPLDGASAAVVLVHGRGATARGMLGMATELPDGVAYLAPQAARRTWYPNSFLEPVDRNEPGRSSGLARLDELVERAGNAGLDPGRVVLVGFSQGGCLASDFLAGNPRRYGGLAALSGGLIGESVDRDSYDGSLAGTPFFSAAARRTHTSPRGSARPRRCSTNSARMSTFAATRGWVTRSTRTNSRRSRG